MQKVTCDEGEGFQGRNQYHGVATPNAGLEEWNQSSSSSNSVALRSDRSRAMTGTSSDWPPPPGAPESGAVRRERATTAGSFEGS
jgi:hypothetical protein